MRVKSLKTLRLKENYLAALEFFYQTSLDKEIDASASTKAKGFLHYMQSFEFFFLLNIIIAIFERIEILNKELQGHELCINESHEKVELVTSSLNQMRKTKFDSLWDNINVEKTEFEIEEPEIKRPRKNPMMIGGMNLKILIMNLISSSLKIIIEKCFLKLWTKLFVL